MAAYVARVLAVCTLRERLLNSTERAAPLRAQGLR